MDKAIAELEQVIVKVANVTDSINDLRQEALKSLYNWKTANVTTTPLTTLATGSQSDWVNQLS